MRRRRFLTLVGGATAWPLVAHAQTAIPVIGYITGRPTALDAYLRESFLKSLEASGFVVGQNVAIEYRHSPDREDQMSELASELVRQQVTVLVATDGPSALAAKAATSTIPIVFTSHDNPVRLGLVASFERPGGNATGVSVFTPPPWRLGGQRLKRIRELLPKPGVIAFVVNPENTDAALQVEWVQRSARQMDQPLVVFRVANAAETEVAFATMAQQNVSAVVYGASVLFQAINDRLVELAARHRIPATYELREAVIAGGLMSYNLNRAKPAILMGRTVAQILMGAKPADLPVDRTLYFLSVINLRTARALGLEIPAAILKYAEVIE